jgi:hypothetical protein
MTGADVGLADWAFRKTFLDGRRLVCWSAVFRYLRSVDDTSVCHALSILHDSFATQDQTAALLAELSAHNLHDALEVMRSLEARRDELDLYVFFEVEHAPDEAIGRAPGDEGVKH